VGWVGGWVGVGRRLEGSIGCSDGVEIESRDDEESKRKGRGGCGEKEWRSADSGTE